MAPPQRSATKKRPKPKRRRGAGPRGTARGSGVRAHWRGLDPLMDARGREVKRFYKLETLASATEHLIGERDRFFVPSIQDVLGPAAVTTLEFNLFIETPARLVFRLRAANAKRKRASFAFVVAKNVSPYSAHLAAEHANLGWLHPRAPRFVLKPLRGGAIYLPDRHRRAGHSREVFAYLAPWPTRFHELGIGKNRRFFVKGRPLQPLTAAQTDDLKARMVAAVVSTYDPVRGDCVAVPDVTQGDFLATRPQRGRGALTLKLISCRGVLKRMTPAKLSTGFWANRTRGTVRRSGSRPTIPTGSWRAWPTPWAVIQRVSGSAPIARP